METAATIQPFFNVEFDESTMYVSLVDGRVIGVPIIWFPILHEAKPAQREQYQIGGDDVSLHWPKLDEGLSVANLLAGADWRSTQVYATVKLGNNSSGVSPVICI